MKTVAAWLDAHGSFATSLAGVLLFFGAAAGCPASGLIATLPVSFCLFALAFFVRRSIALQLSLSAVFSLGYGFARGAASPFVYAGAMSLLALAGAGLIACLKRVKVKKAFWIPAVPVLLAGVILPAVLYGTPGAYLSAAAAARDYLARRYPDQAFTAADCYRDPVLGVWHCDCAYLNEGNTLSSVILFGETVEDGFLADRVSAAQEKRRSAFIEALRDAGEPVLVEPDGFSDDLKSRQTVPGTYEQYDPALEKDMRFSLTFRREKTQKREFALAIRDVTALLRERGLCYDALRFVAMSAGEPVYACTVTGKTGQEELMDLIERV